MGRQNSPTAPHGDMGIGLCLACCNLHLCATVEQARKPRLLQARKR